MKLSSEVSEELKRLRKSDSLDDDELLIIAHWIIEMEEFGPNYIKASSYWFDHALTGKWFGYRSSAFSTSGRIIYKVRQKEVVISVVRITNTHDYR